MRRKKWDGHTSFISVNNATLMPTFCPWGLWHTHPLIQTPAHAGLEQFTIAAYRKSIETINVHLDLLARLAEAYQIPREKWNIHLSQGLSMQPMRSSPDYQLAMKLTLSVLG